MGSILALSWGSCPRGLPYFLGDPCLLKPRIRLESRVFSLIILQHYPTPPLQIHLISSLLLESGCLIYFLSPKPGWQIRKKTRVWNIYGTIPNKRKSVYVNMGHHFEEYPFSSLIKMHLSFFIDLLMFFQFLGWARLKLSGSFLNAFKNECHLHLISYMSSVSYLKNIN